MCKCIKLIHGQKNILNKVLLPAKTIVLMLDSIQWFINHLWFTWKRKTPLKESFL